MPTPSEIMYLLLGCTAVGVTFTLLLYLLYKETILPDIWRFEGAMCLFFGYMAFLMATKVYKDEIETSMRKIKSAIGG